jgi:hypothetical protein
MIVITVIVTPVPIGILVAAVQAIVIAVQSAVIPSAVPLAVSALLIVIPLVVILVVSIIDALIVAIIASSRSCACRASGAAKAPASKNDVKQRNPFIMAPPDRIRRLLKLLVLIFRCRTSAAGRQAFC